MTCSEKPNNWKWDFYKKFIICGYIEKQEPEELESFIENLLRERTEEVLKEIAKSELILRGEEFFMMVYREHFGLNPKEGE